MCTKEQLERVYNLGYAHGKAYAEMKAALFATDKNVGRSIPVKDLYDEDGDEIR